MNPQPRRSQAHRPNPQSSASELSHPKSGGSWFRFGWLIAPLAAFAIFIPALSYDFTFDDDAIIAGNPRIERLDRPMAYLATSWWNVTGQDKEYRPATMASFALNYAVHQRRPFGYHLVNNLLHALNAALVWFLAARLAHNHPFARWIALAAGLLFAIHPIHLEAVAGIVGRAELQMTAGYLFALLASLRSRDATSSRTRYGWSAAVLAASLFSTFSKEQGVTLPVVIALLALAEPVRPLRQSLLALLPCILAAAFADLAYFTARHEVIGAFITPEKNFTSLGANPLVALDPVRRRIAAIAIFSLIAKSLVIPWPQSPDYSFAVFKPFDLAESLLFPVGFLLLALCLLLAAVYRRQPAARFGILLMLASLTVASNLVITIGTAFGERLLYLPSAGFLLFLAAAAFDPRWSSRVRAVAAPLLSVWTLALLAMHFVYLPYWRDTLTLMAYAVERVPDSANARQAWAIELRDRGRLEEAFRHIDRAAQIEPNDYYRAMRAVMLIELGSPEPDSIADLERGHTLKPDSLPINKHLVEHLTRQGLLDRAERVLVEGFYANYESSASRQMLEDWRAQHRVRQP